MYKIIIISQSCKVMTSCQTANNLHAPIICMKTKNIQIYGSIESINKLDIYWWSFNKHTEWWVPVKTATNIPATITQLTKVKIKIQTNKESINELKYSE